MISSIENWDIKEVVSSAKIIETDTDHSTSPETKKAPASDPCRTAQKIWSKNHFRKPLTTEELTTEEVLKIDNSLPKTSCKGIFSKEFHGQNSQPWRGHRGHLQQTFLVEMRKKTVKTKSTTPLIVETPGLKPNWLWGNKNCVAQKSL